MFEGQIDALLTYMAVEEASDLGPAQALGVHVKGLADAASGWIDGCGVEEKAGTGAAVVPHGQSSLKMAGLDAQAAIQGGVDGTEAQHLSFGAAGGGAVYVRAPLTQMAIVMVPHFLSLWTALEDSRGLGVDPVQCTAQLPGQGGLLLGRETSSVGERLAAVHAGPEATVGKAVVSLTSAQVVEEFTLGEVSDEAYVRASGLDGPVAIVGGKIAAIPSATKQRRELRGLAAEQMEDGAELLQEEQEATIGGRLLISQGMENGVGCGAMGGDAVRGPEAVDFGEEGGDLAPACSFAGLARFAYEDNEEIETMTGGADKGMGLGASEIAEGGEELQENGHGIGLAVWGKTAKDEAGNTMESGIGEHGRLGGGGSSQGLSRRLGTQGDWFRRGLFEREGTHGPGGRLRHRLKT